MPRFTEPLMPETTQHWHSTPAATGLGRRQDAGWGHRDPTQLACWVLPLVLALALVLLLQLMKTEKETETDSMGEERTDIATVAPPTQAGPCLGKIS